VLRPSGAIETEIAEMIVGNVETIDIATATMGTMGMNKPGSRATATV
jgi:hypothetical protein